MEIKIYTIHYAFPCTCDTRIARDAIIFMYVIIAIFKQGLSMYFIISAFKPSDNDLGGSSLSCLDPVVFLLQKTFKLFVLWILWLLSVPDEGYSSNVPDDGYSRNVSCALNVMSTFLFVYVSWYFLMYLFITSLLNLRQYNLKFEIEFYFNQIGLKIEYTGPAKCAEVACKYFPENRENVVVFDVAVGIGLTAIEVSVSLIIP